jgi:DNA-binding transcriptional LysR family regulator
LIVPEAHPWAKLGIVEPDDLLKQPMIIREPTSGTRRILLSQLSQHDISLDDLNIFMEIGNAEAIVWAVAAGHAVSFVSTLAITFALELGKVVEVQVAGLDLRRKIYMIRKILEKPHRPQEAFWSFIRSSDNADLIRLAEGNIR